MNRSTRLNRIRYWIQFIPFSWNTALLIVLGVWIRSFLLKGSDNTKTVASSFQPFIALMVETLLWLLVACTLFAFGSVLICYLHFRWRIRRQKETVHVTFTSANDQQKTNKIGIRIYLEHVWRPLLGSVKCRLVYDNDQLSPTFVISGNKRQANKLLRQGIATDSGFQLPDIKEYRLTGCLFYFEDLFHFFSFAYRHRQTQHFFQTPGSLDLNSPVPQPRQARTDDMKTTELHTLPGDYLNYKHFESGDDIRRVVWKIYAKNRELVVRIPEMKDRYADRRHVYVSFFTDVALAQRTNVFADELLNYYKQAAWTVLEPLSQQQPPAVYEPDDPMHPGTDSAGADRMRRILSHASWQTTADLNQYVDHRKAALVCVSSFNSIQDVRQMLDRCSRETIVVYVRLSDAFLHANPFGLLGRIFLRAPDDRLRRIRTRWPFTMLKYELKKRETVLEQVLDRYDIPVVKIKPEKAQQIVAAKYD